MKLFNNLKLGTKVLAVFVAVGLLSISTVATISFIEADIALEAESFNKLTAVREIKADQIENYFQQIRNQVLTLSESRMVVDAMKEFKKSFHNIDKELNVSEKDLARMDANLKNTYQSEFLTRLNPNLDTPASVSEFLPKDIQTRVLQNLYISENASEAGSKHNLDAASDGSSYSRAHALYHPPIRSFLDKFSYYDIFLIDNETGHIVYSVYKEADYATSLKTGPYSSTNFAEVFKQAANAGDAGFSKMIDFKPYKPSYNAQASFIASPIFDGDKKVGVLVFQMPLDKINNVMTSNGKWADVGLGASGETYLVGEDLKLRSQSRFLIEDADGYFALMAEVGMDSSVVDKIRKFGSAIGLQPVRTHGTEAAISGKTATEIFADYRGVPVLSAYRPLKIQDMNWAIMSEIDEAEAFEAVYSLRDQILILATAILGLTVVIAMFFSKRVITNPINKMLAAVDDLREGDGDLTYRLKISSRDEIGQTSESLNGFLEKMQGVLLQVRTSVENVASASEQVNSSAQSLSQGSSEQAASVEETSASLEQMNASITQNTENAKVTDGIATKAADEATEGGSAVSETVQAMNEIAGKIGLIEDIAYKTNLLALNAAIEAARAGEHGKGFAVVADEVRKLAERSQVSAQEISEQATDSVKIAERAGSLLEAMVPNIKKTADLVQEITAASEEQSSGVQQVNSAMEQLDQVAQTSASSSEELAATSEELSANAESLMEIIGFFKLGDDKSSTSAQKKESGNSPVTKKKAKAESKNDDVHPDDFEKFPEAV